MRQRYQGRHVRLVEHTRRRIPLLLVLLALLPLTSISAVRGGPSEAAPLPALSNGCTVSARGLPSCGAYAGGAYGSNSDLAPWEARIGRQVGIHRTYYGPTQVASAVRMAAADLAKKRVPWISFKVPYTWAQMAAGKGDSWARDIATRMKALGGPVWIAFHHEPESESQDVLHWKAMQNRLGPIVRSAAPNVAFTVILMGYHEFMANNPKYAMDRIWPTTKVDVAGFDIYERYGVVKNGVMDRKWTPYRDGYFAKIKAWSAKTGVKWGLAETGYSDPAAKANPRWIRDTFKLMTDAGGIAFAYFNTTLHSKAHWELGTNQELLDFNAAHLTSARLN